MNQLRRMTHMHRVAIAIGAAGLFVLLAPGIAVAADTVPPSVPQNVLASNGATSPAVATLSWDAATDDVAVTGYYVWRSTTPSGTPTICGETETTTFSDVTGVPGQDYFYYVSAFDAARNWSALSTPPQGPVRATWMQEPHATYNTAGDLCRYCHAVHGAASQTALMRQTSSDNPGEISVCYACHDGRGATADVKNGAVNSFALASGHSLEESATAPDLSDKCSSCHNPHLDVDPASGSPMLPNETINGQPVTGSDNTWCYSCHNSTNDWYGPGYPGMDAPTRGTDGYPTAGTFPGPAIYADASKNRHAAIPATSTAGREWRSSGDCLYCHASHRGPNEYDGLVDTFAPSTAASVVEDQTDGTYAAVCFDCHGGELRSEFATMPVDIKQFVTAGRSRSGHRIKTAGGDLPVGAPLPCYDCHNPHGSTRGNASMLSDELGQNLSTSTDAGVRATCFTCHTSSDGRVWRSVAATYTAVAATQTVEGLRRDGADGSALRIPAVSGHAVADTQSCYDCHGDDYAAGGFNVHNPTGGVSPGGVDCYACHSTYQGFMEDDVGSKTGDANRTLVYHHVMGSSTADGDTAFAAGSYPGGSATDVYCMSCHADHDQFNDSKAFNLRADLTSSATTAASDYAAASPYGICVSCHTSSLAKDTTNQKDDGSTSTPKIVGGAGTGGFGNSAHSYETASGYDDATVFGANCSKCHNDEQSKSYQTTANRFGTHWSATRRLLAALGTTVSDPLAEEHCYRCHSATTDTVGGTAKTFAGRDWYDSAGMSTPSELVYRQFQLGGSTHPVVARGSDSVECESCHNAHVVTGASRVTDPDNTYATLPYSSAAEQAAFCLRCHDGTLPSQAVNNTFYVPYSVTMSDTVLNNKAANGARGHWSVNGAISASETKSCAVCHDNHGSSYEKLIGAYDATTGTNRVNGVAITGNNTTVCTACHTDPSTDYPAFTRLANGYPDTGTWPSYSIYASATVGIHNDTTVVWPGSNYIGGDCKNCHDVHGTSNTYDELRGTFTSTDYSMCLTCHDSTGPSTRNVSQYYWISAGGTVANGTDRASHSGDAGAAVPCYDCHNPHGSASADGLMVVTQASSTTTLTLGDDVGEFDLSTVQGVRDFCFACHLPNNASNQGYSGTPGGTVTVDNTAVVDGYNRVSQLKITQSGQAHTLYTRNQSCIQSMCHANPHRPE